MDAEQKLQQLNRKVSDLFFGLKLIALLFLYVASTGNIIACLSIEHYRQLFADALPGKPLPGLTLFVFAYRSLLYWLAFIWPLIGLATMFIRESIRVATAILATLLVVTLLESSLIVLAMQLPMVTLINGMSDSHP